MKTIREQAMDFLARREHSRHELRQKLLRKGHDEIAIENVLQQLIIDNLQSDQRFAKAYVRHRVASGYGPLRIKKELQHRGVPQNIIDEYMPSDNAFWNDVLKKLWYKKFQDQASKDRKVLARQYRFLMQRGFHIDAIKALFADEY